MKLGCGCEGCEQCGRHAEYALIGPDGKEIPLCPQCAFAVVFGEAEITIAVIGGDNGEDIKPKNSYIH